MEEPPYSEVTSSFVMMMAVFNYQVNLHNLGPAPFDIYDQLGSRGSRDWATSVGEAAIIRHVLSGVDISSDLTAILAGTTIKAVGGGSWASLDIRKLPLQTYALRRTGWSFWRAANSNTAVMSSGSRYG